VINLTKSEELMYSVMGAVANSNIPIVYKGAMITKLILSEHGFDSFVRETQDIDASWVGDSIPSAAQMADMLNHALLPLGLIAEVKREHGIGKSAGVKVKDASTKEDRLSMDIDIRADKSVQRYKLGEVSFSGVTPNKVIADKISVIASVKVFRRAKDLIDLYALAHCVKFSKWDIYKLWASEKRSLGDFAPFLTRSDELEFAYNKLQRIEPKPDFAQIYEYLTAFLEPFITPSLTNHVWECEDGRWTVVPAKSFDAKLENGKLLSSVHSGNNATELRRTTEHEIGD
jgi:hypothetical protein